jgi:hypothetical protein
VETALQGAPSVLKAIDIKIQQGKGYRQDDQRSKRQQGILFDWLNNPQL